MARGILQEMGDAVVSEVTIRDGDLSKAEIAKVNKLIDDFVDVEAQRRGLVDPGSTEPCERRDGLDLLDNPGKASDIPVDAVPPLLLKIAAVQTAVAARLASQSMKTRSQTETDEAPAEDRLLTAEEAATIAGTTARWFYRHKLKLPFTRKLSRKVLRFSEKGLRKWLSQRRA